MTRACIGLTLLTLASALASGCGTPCQNARARIDARYAECGLALAKPEEPVGEEVCSTADGEIQKCFADCADSATCEALTGEDEEARDDYVECYEFCSG
jgi:hypothetical protein